MPRQASLGGSPLPWTTLDGSPRCVCTEANADGRAELLGVNRDGIPFHRAQVSAGGAAWTPWAQLAGRFTSVAAARNADGRAVVFGVTFAGSAVLWRAQASPGVWAGSAWQPLGALATAIAAGCGGEDTLHLGSRPEQESSRDALRPMDAGGSPFGSRIRTNAQHISGATVLPGEHTSTRCRTRYE